MNLYLQNIINDTFFENLPVKWQEFNLPASCEQVGFVRFSREKTLYRDLQELVNKDLLKALGEKKRENMYFHNRQLSDITDIYWTSFSKRTPSKKY